MTIAEEIYSLIKSNITDQEIVNCTRLDPKYVKRIRKDPSIMYSFPLRVDLALAHAWELYTYNDQDKFYNFLHNDSNYSRNKKERAIGHLIGHCLHEDLNVAVNVSWHKHN